MTLLQTYEIRTSRSSSEQELQNKTKQNIHTHKQASKQNFLVKNTVLVCHKGLRSHTHHQLTCTLHGVRDSASLFHHLMPRLRFGTDGHSRSCWRLSLAAIYLPLSWINSSHICAILFLSRFLTQSQIF